MAAQKQPKRSARTRRVGPTKKQRDGYLAALREGATMKQAAESVGRSRGLFEALYRRDPEFAVEHDEAYEEGGDVLEREAFRRAVEGVEDIKAVGAGPGQVIVEFRNYSDRLLELLLKARRPAKFRDNVKVENVGPGGGPQKVEVTLTDDDARAAYNALIEAGLVQPGPAALADPEA